MPKAGFEEQVFFSTVRVVSVGQDMKASLGTAFLVNEPVDEQHRVILAVSNKHVLIDPARHILLEMTKAGEKDGTTVPLLGNTVRLQGNALGELSYFEHPDADVDLACINLSRIETEGVYCRTLNLSMSATFEEDWLLPNREVCFVGYPDGRYDKRNNLPILRRGVVASLPKVDFDGQKQFLIDAQVFSGSSGSPVFMQPNLLGGEVKFVGVLNAGMKKNSRLQKFPANLERFGIEHTIGLGYVLKPILVQELVAHAVTKIKASLAPKCALPDASQAA